MWTRPIFRSLAQPSLRREVTSGPLSERTFSGSPRSSIRRSSTRVTRVSVCNAIHHADSVLLIFDLAHALHRMMIVLIDLLPGSVGGRDDERILWLCDIFAGNLADAFAAVSVVLPRAISAALGLLKASGTPIRCPRTRRIGAGGDDMRGRQFRGVGHRAIARRGMLCEYCLIKPIHKQASLDLLIPQSLDSLKGDLDPTHDLALLV